MSTNFDCWFTYCVLSQQNSVSVEFSFELFNLENFLFGSHKLHSALKSNLGSLLWFHSSLNCRNVFLGQYTAKLSYLCKSCKGAKIALTPPPPPPTVLLAFLLLVNIWEFKCDVLSAFLFVPFFFENFVIR